MHPFRSIIKNGIVTENPTFRLVLGMCPTLAVSTSVGNALGMGVATTFVLVCSNLAVSLLRNFVPDSIRIPSYVVIIATFATAVELLMTAFLPDLARSLGVYIPLIVVNCIVFARAESYASKNPPLAAAADGLGMGLGFTIGIASLGAVRELLGAGTLLGYPVLLDIGYTPALLFVLAPGGFIVLGLLMGLVGQLRRPAKEA